MDRSFLVKLFGFPITLIHGDPMVLDRWLWLRRRLPRTLNGEKLIDIGCGTGQFTIGAARRGYTALGLSYDEANQAEAKKRAALCKAETADFEVVDVRNLDQRADLIDAFDIAICLETMEHILNDFKLMRDIARCLRPGGRLLLTTPYYHHRPMIRAGYGPFSKTEDGGHVRRGYSKAMLQELCSDAGLVAEEFSFCTGYLSQKLTGFQWRFTRVNFLLTWLFTLPLRPLIPPLDPPATRLLSWPHFSICLEAYKPRKDSPT